MTHSDATTKRTKPDPRILALAERLYGDALAIPMNRTKSADYYVQKAIADAVAFFEIIDTETWNKSSAERMAEL